MSNKQPAVAGRKVLFVGGPEAGNVRLVPESEGDHLMGEHDFVYRIWPIRIHGDKRTIHFAYAADQHPLEMYIDMWREYSPAAQIRGATGAIQTYQKVAPK